MSQFNYSLKLKKEEISIRQCIYEVGGYRYNWHKEIEIMFVLSGKVEVCVEGNIYDLEEGDIVIINPNEGHASLKKEDGSMLMVLHIDPKYLGLFYDEKKQIKFNCNTYKSDKYNENFNEMRKLLSKMMFSMSKNTLGSDFESLGYLSLLVSIIIDNFSQDNTKNSSYKKQQVQLKTVVDYIENKYREKICLDDIANLVNYNASYTSSFFKNHLGINFYEYLLRVRLQSAVFDLMTTNKAIYNIALDNGFSDVKAFNASFKKNFNKSPNEYRVSNKSIKPILSLDKRSFIESDNKIVIEKLKQYIEPDKNHNENNNDEIRKSNELEDIDEIKIVYNKDGENDEFFNYLKKSNIKLKLEIS